MPSRHLADWWRERPCWHGSSLGRDAGPGSTQPQMDRVIRGEPLNHAATRSEREAARGASALPCLPPGFGAPSPSIPAPGTRLQMRTWHPHRHVLDECSSSGAPSDWAESTVTRRTVFGGTLDERERVRFSEYHQGPTRSAPSKRNWFLPRRTEADVVESQCFARGLHSLPSPVAATRAESGSSAARQRPVSRDEGLPCAGWRMPASMSGVNPGLVR